jgi:hypothetical protein
MRRDVVYAACAFGAFASATRRVSLVVALRDAAAACDRCFAAVALTVLRGRTRCAGIARRSSSRRAP